MDKAKTFETTYSGYSFAPLVALGLAIAALLKGNAGKTDKSGRARTHAGPVGGAVGHVA